MLTAESFSQISIIKKVKQSFKDNYKLNDGAGSLKSSCDTQLLYKI